VSIDLLRKGGGHAGGRRTLARRMQKPTRMQTAIAAMMGMVTSMMAVLRPVLSEGEVDPGPVGEGATWRRRRRWW